MAGHTPGPWIVDPIDKEYVVPAADPGGTGICVLSPMDNTDELWKFGAETQANARLIAAAPDLLDALQALTELYNTDEGCRALPEYKGARAAIAKATGGAD